MKNLCLSVLAATLTGGFPVAAATFTADFNTGTVPAGSSVIGSATVTATGGAGNTGVLRLTEAVGGQIGTWFVNDFSGGAAVNAFNATFKVELGAGSAPPADGFSFAWSTSLSGAAFGEEGEANGLVVAFDTFDNGGGEAPAIDVKWNNTVLAHSAVPFNFSAANAAFVTVQVTLANGTVTVIWNGVTVHSGVGLAGFAAFSGAKFGFGARTGGATERHYIDDVSIATTLGSGSSGSFAKRAALQTDADANGKAGPGDTLRYTISITNTFGTNLLNVQFNDASFPNQTLVAGTVTATPLARADAPAANSVPGNAFHGAFNTTLNIPAGSGLLANDFLGTPAATIASFGGGTFGGSVTDHAAGTSAVAAGVGTLTVNANGSLTFTPVSTFTGTLSFQYRLSNSVGTSDVTATLAIGIRPAAATDAYNVTGNTMMDSSLIPQTVLANDSGDGLGISANTAGVNGTVTVSANGHFVFTPNAAFTGAASFTYTITNGFGPATGTVNLTVANKVWYIDNSVVANGDGRSSSPFKQTSDFTTANDGAAGHPADNDLVFIRQGSGNYTSSATLRAGQKLIGDGSSGTLNAAFGITFAPGSAKAAATALPAFTGTDPVIENTAAGGNGIALNSGNTLRGLTVGNTPNGYGYSGGAVGALTISESSKTGTGGAISVGTSGTLAASFDTLSSSSAPAAGINLVGCSGTLTATSGSISAPVGTAVNISGGSATITYPGDITKNNAGRVADIQSRTGARSP